MQSNFDYQMKLCVDEFINLYNSDSYISKSIYQKYLDKYNDIFNQYSVLPDNEYKEKIKTISNNIDSIFIKHNIDFVNRKMESEKEYFDNIFSDVDSNILLDLEQRKAILIDEDYSLVIAGAGSGKTTTMTAKVKYLIEKCNVDPKEIVVLSFTKATVKELENRLNNDFKLNVNVKTFHKLGLEILNDRLEEKVSGIDNYKKIQIINDYVKEIAFQNKIILKTLIELFPTTLRLAPACLDYNSFQEYWDFYTKKVYDENKNNLFGYNNFIIERRKENYRTILNEFVRSKAEVEIANFLYLNGIEYKYEQKYEEGKRKVSYMPDFTVILPSGNKIYIEYYGLDSFDENGLYTQEELEKYRMDEKRKRKLHDTYGTDLIEVKPSNSFLHILENELKNKGVYFTSKDDYQVFLDLMNTSKDGQIYYFSNYILNFISKFKSKGYTDKNFDFLSSKTDDEKVKRKLACIRHIYLYYNKYIHSKNMIDFEDMIYYAYRYMIEKPINNSNLSYKYIIVDEYQDISNQRFNLLQTISDVFNAKIIAVGDDWQSIFEFSGSDIKLFTHFCELMGYGEIVKITNTYRNSQELIDIAGDFVLKNTSQVEKHLVSPKHLINPIELIYYNHDVPYTKAHILEKILDRLYEQDNQQSIALLGRFNEDIKVILESSSFREGIKSQHKIIYNKHLDMDIRFLTVHSSKGLGFDQVILLNAVDDIYGFPSKKRDDAIFRLLVEDEETIKYAEERRLFYVALTRTKNKMFILTPNHNESSFIIEIKNYKNVISNYDYLEQLELI